MPVLLPFDSVHPFLTDSPLVKLTKVDVKPLYDAIIEIMTEWDRQRSVPKVEVVTKAPRCSHCKIGYFVIDEVEANRVCGNCGIVAETGLILENNCQTFNERHDDMIRHERAVPKDVPKWLQQSLDAQGDEGHRFDVYEKLESLNSNPYAQNQRLPKDDLEKAKRDAMIPLRGNPLIRATAAMLAPKIDAYFDMKDMRVRISKSMPLPVMTYDPPVPKYACFRCGAAVFEPYMQRRHPCGWGKRKR